MARLFTDNDLSALIEVWGVKYNILETVDRLFMEQIIVKLLKVV